MPLAPIFAKKKPRQALLAHPNNTASPNDKNGSFGFYTSAWNSGSSPAPEPQSFYNQEPAPKRTAYNKVSSAYHTPQLADPRAAPSPAAPKATRFPTQRSLQFLSTSRPQARAQPPPSAPPSKYYGGQPSVQETQPQAAQPAWGSPMAPNFRHSWRPGQQQQLTPGRQSTYGVVAQSSQSSVSVPGCGGPGPQRIEVNRRLNWTNQAVGQPPSQHTLSYTPCPPNAEPQRQGPQTMANMSAEPDSKQVGASGTPGNSFKMQDKTPDCSLRFLPASIQSMRHWSKYKRKVPLIFELFGTLGSAVTANESGTARQFVLQNGKDAVQCTFYTIDRELPRMLRGHWYRCVGQLESDGEHFRSVTVREATQEERKLHSAAITAADKAMRGCVSDNREL